MKELSFKIKQVFIGTRVVENKLKYQILCAACAMIHLVFMILFYSGRVYSLSLFNIASTILYLLGGFVLATKEKYRVLFIVAFCEIEINSVISSILLGSGYDFMIYTLSLIPGAFYMAHTWPSTSKNKYGISLIPHISTFVIGICYVVVEVLYSSIKPVYSGAEIIKLKTAFHFFNIVIAVLLLLVFSILFAFEVRHILRLLNDENSRLGEIAARDPLTKVLNRRSLYDIVKQKVEEETNIEFGLILLDIDDFKKVNDTYGHNVGDQVLIKIAEIMKENIRDNDYVCRWGGEEFLLMIHGTTSDYAVVAERIRKSIEDQTFQVGELTISVTATLGISQYQTGLKLRTLIDMADQKMYYGKNHGKNQVVS